MPTPDHGNFDFAIEIAQDTLTSVAKSHGIPPIPPWPFDTPDMRGRVKLQIRIDDINLVVPNIFRLILNMQGSTIEVTHITLSGVSSPVQPWLQNVAIGGTIVIDDLLEMRSNTLLVDFTADDAAGTPMVRVNLDESAILASPLIQFILAQAILEDPVGGTVYQQKRTQLLQRIKDGITQGVRGYVTSLGVRNLVPPLIPGVPPLIPGVTSSNFRVGDRAIHVLYHTCGSGGNPALIARSNLLRRTSDGQPLDVASLILSNSGFLGCFVRPSITASAGLSPAGFVPGHPFLWFGRIPFAIPGGLPAGISGVFVTSMMAGIDGTNLRVLANVVADGVAGAFTVNASVDTAFSVTATSTTATSLTFAIAPRGTPAVRSDISIAPWVYVGGVLTGGLGLVTVLAAIDAFGGLLLDGIIARSILLPPSPSLTIGLPVPMTVRAQSLGQPDAPTRTVTVALPFGFSFTFTDPFPANDMIINLV